MDNLNQYVDRKTSINLSPPKIKQIERIRIRAFKAVDEPHSCFLFIKKHQDILKNYGLQSITSNNNNWPNNPNVYVLVSESLTTGEMIGGVRIHIANEHERLPIEAAVYHMDPKIVDLIKKYSLRGGVGETCGLWSSLYQSGREKIGLGHRLTRAAVSVVNQLNITNLLAIVGRPMLKSCRNIGFVENKLLGNNGTFPYPKEDLHAWALGYLNAKTLVSASSKDKKIIQELRDKSCQIKKEQAGRLELNIDYQLKFKGHPI